MPDNYHGAPLIIQPDGSAFVLNRLMVGDAGVGADYDEDAIRNLAFDHPECLPIGEIDTGYLNPIPVCKELATPAGPIDALLVTRTGRLVIVEAKLWKNPEARRKVIGQILDYAKELKRWGYNDLQREVARSTGRKGNALFEIARAGGGELDEASFVDAISRSLKQGRFLLLVIGDGIKEGAASIASFLQETGTLEYTLGMVEMALYAGKETGVWVQPRVLAKTEIVERTVLEIRDDRISVDASTSEIEAVPEESENQRWSREFWTELLSELSLDDPQQPTPTPSNRGLITFSMPPSGQQVYVSAFFVQNEGLTGVNLRLLGGELGDRLYAALEEEKETIEAEIGAESEWEDFGEKGYGISLLRTYEKGQTKAPENRDEIKEFFKENINRFVNAFRPRLKRLVEE